MNLSQVGCYYLLLASGTHEDVYIGCVPLKSILMGMDQWSFKPALMSLVTVAAVELVCGIPGHISFFLIPLSLLGYGIASFVILTVALYCVIKKRLRRGASVLLMLLLPAVLWWPINWAMDVIHLGLTVDFGAGQLTAPSKSSDGNLVAYDWSVGFAGSTTFLIRDATDEIALPMAQHARPPSSEDGFGEECAGKVRHLIGHYYACSF